MLVSFGKEITSFMISCLDDETKGWVPILVLEHLYPEDGPEILEKDKGDYSALKYAWENWYIVERNKKNEC